MIIYVTELQTAMAFNLSANLIPFNYNLIGTESFFFTIGIK